MASNKVFSYAQIQAKKGLKLEIEKGIPVPEAKGPGRSPNGESIYPIAQLEVGESFAIPVMAGEKAKVIQSRMASASRRHALLFKRKQGGQIKKFVTRILEDGKLVRIWRIE